MKVGIDCGGTTCEAVVLDADGKIVETIQKNHPATKEVLYEFITSVLEKYSDIYFIGIGFPGPVWKGVVSYAPNISGWDNVDLENDIKEKFKVPCRVENDANTFAYAHSEEGKVVAGITLGTGLGSGITHGKKILLGSKGNAGEIGRIPYLEKTFEDYCSKKFFTQDPYQVYLSAKKGEQDAIELYKEYGKHLGKMLASVIVAYDPCKIVIGGGPSGAWDLFEPSMNLMIKKFVPSYQAKNVVIEKNSLEYPICLGAAQLEIIDFI